MPDEQLQSQLLLQMRDGGGDGRRRHRDALRRRRDRARFGGSDEILQMAQGEAHLRSAPTTKEEPPSPKLGEGRGGSCSIERKPSRAEASPPPQPSPASGEGILERERGTVRPHYLSPGTPKL